MTKRQKSLSTLLIILALAGAGFLFWMNRSTSSTSERLKQAGNEQIAEQHQNPVADDSNNGAQSSGVTDSGGANFEANSNPVVSESGVIKLHRPIENQKLVTGSEVSGEAGVNEVYYRIKDNVRGVIGQGSLSVVNGKFSGKITINASGDSGTFEIYSVTPEFGAEANNIKIKVTF